MFILPTLKGLAAGSLSSNTFKNAALDLNFASNKSLVDSVSGNNLISFARATAGTYVGADGLIKTAVTNLLLRSEEFDNASWVNISSGDAVVQANQETSPSGTLAADKFQDDTTNLSGSRAIYQQVAGTQGIAYTFHVYVKAAGVNWVFLQFQSFGSFSSTRGAYFGLSTGATGTITGTTTATITNAGNGWYRCAITATADVTSSIRARIFLAEADNDVTYTGTVGNGIYLWGAQLEQSSTVGEYIPTTSTINSAPRFDHNPTTGESLGLLVEEARTNLSQQSDNFSDAYWAKTDCTITANESTAPDGTLTADLWTNTASPGIVQTSITKDATARTYTGSLWVKGDSTAFTMSIDDGSTANRGRSIFNLSTGILASILNSGTFTNTSGTITAYANGWYRLTVTTTTSTGTAIRLRPFFSNIGATARIWGAQIEEGTFATSYIPTGAAAVITPGYASPAVTRAADVASVTGANFGVTRTNYIRNNTMVGAVAGTPGTLPTNWGTAGSAALSTQIIGTGVDDGINYIDVRCFGTTAAVASPEIYFNFDVGPAISVAQNQTWTTSCYAKIVGGTQTGIINGEIYVLGLNSSSVLTEAAPATFNYSSLTGAFSTCRVSKTHTFTVATTVYSQQRIDVNFTAGGGTAVDFTLRIGMPQMEVGSVATAAIPTTTAAASVFESSWYNQTEGTFYGDSIFAANTNTRLVSVNTNATANRITITRGTGSNGNFNLVVSDASVVQVNSLVLGSNIPAGSSNKVAAVYKAADFAGSLNGLTPVTQGTGTVPGSLTQLTIGNGEVLGSNTMTGTIKRLVFWRTRLPDVTLQEVTKP